MVNVGDTNQLTVSRKAPAGYYLADEGGNEVLLPGRLAPPNLSVGDVISAFVYTDSEDRPVATTQAPLAKVGDFACLRVVDESEHGAFLDWGLDKDLFVPRSEQHQKLIIGRTYVFAVYLDNRTNRVAAASKLGEFFDYDVSNLKEGSPVNLLVYGISEVGAQVIVDDRFSGMIHRSELFSRVEIGQKLSGFLAKVRADNKLDVRLRRTGPQGQKDTGDLVLAALRSADGVLSLGDKSPPEEIEQRLGISKKSFKAAVGALYKAGLVEPGPTETRLKEPEQ